jgi:hypothetical protein
MRETRALSLTADRVAESFVPRGFVPPARAIALGFAREHVHERTQQPSCECLVLVPPTRASPRPAAGACACKGIAGGRTKKIII